MREAQKPDHISLQVLVSRLREQRFVIPDFQREFEWKPWDIRDLIRSIFLDYFIGSLLLWKGKSENFDALSCEPLYGDESRNGNEIHVVLDGQQRLTAMQYVFLAPDKPLPNRSNRFHFYIRVDRFMDGEYDQAFEYTWKGTRVNMLLNDLEGQYENHMFPLSIIGKDGWDLPNWFQGYEEHWRAKEKFAKDAGKEEETKHATRRAEDANAFSNHTLEIMQKYQISYIELDSELEIDKVCDIFTQINSRGIRLDIFDLINALLKPKGVQLKKLWREASPRLDFVDTDRMNVYLLQVMSILRQAYCSPKYLYYLLPGQQKQVRDSTGSLRKEILVTDESDFEKGWNESVDSVEKSIGLISDAQEFGAISARFLPYVTIIPAFAALNLERQRLPDTLKFEALQKLKLWYWASVFTTRYSGAVESTSARDYLDVKNWFKDNDAEPALISEFRNTFNNLDLSRETKRGTSVYNGIFNLLILNGCRDWKTGLVIKADDVDDHHIVPKNWGKSKSLEVKIDSILNRTPLAAVTNRELIKDRLPNEYLPELIAESGYSKVREMMEVHFVSPVAMKILMRDPFTEKDFADFAKERRRTLVAAIEDLILKERMNLSLSLRQLAADIESIEVALRKIINKTLTGDQGLLPPHVQQKIKERISRALRKDALYNEGHYETLDGSLEFADLSDLKDSILNSNLWPRFDRWFVNKMTFQQYFDHLTVLRNGIAHNRSVDEITQKNGEVAILWFREKLRPPR